MMFLGGFSYSLSVFSLVLYGQTYHGDAIGDGILKKYGP